VIIELDDYERMAAFDDWYSDYVIDNGKVYWATSDDDQVELVVYPVDDFIRDNDPVESLQE
jgi:hypothetical protein